MKSGVRGRGMKPTEPADMTRLIHTYIKHVVHTRVCVDHSIQSSFTLYTLKDEEARLYRDERVK